MADKSRLIPSRVVAAVHRPREGRGVGALVPSATIVFLEDGRCYRHLRGTWTPLETVPGTPAWNHEVGFPKGDEHLAHIDLEEDAEE